MQANLLIFAFQNSFAFSKIVKNVGSLYFNPKSLEETKARNSSKNTCKGKIYI